MSYVNLDPDYFSHPKTVRLTGLLGRNAEALPIRLWCYCARYHAEDGRLTGYSPQEIERAVGWWGKSGVMVEALVTVGFLEHTAAGYGCHEWLDHQGHLIALKRRGQQAAKARWKQLLHTPATHAKEPAKQCSTPYQTSPDHAMPSHPDGTPLPQASTLLPGPGFDRFWEAYPRKVGKAAAARLWRTLHPDDALLGAMLDALERAAHTDQWQREAGRFIPHPATWLSQRRWEDELPDSLLARPRLNPGLLALQRLRHEEGRGE